MDPTNQWTPGNDLVLVRNENYWRQKPPIARQRFTVITDDVARLTNYMNGLGTMVRASPEAFRTKSEDPEFAKKNHTLEWTNMRSGFGFTAWNCGPRNGKLTPFHDKRVRLAMTCLLDRDRILRDFYYGYGQVATSPFPPRSPMNNPDIKPWPYDMDKARQLLAEAGWIDRDGDGILENDKGEEFEFEYTLAEGGTVSPKIAKYLKDQCAKVGIRMVERVVDWSIYSDILDNRDFDALTMMWSQSLPESDPYQLWDSESIKNRGDNFVQYSNPEADRLIEEGRRELDDDKRMKIWHKLHEVLHEDQPYTFDINAPYFRFVRGTVSNVHTYPIGLDKTEMYFAMPRN
jgi:peptide/nickel transport system substrate-binding protein